MVIIRLIPLTAMIVALTMIQCGSGDSETSIDNTQDSLITEDLVAYPPCTTGERCYIKVLDMSNEDDVFAPGVDIDAVFLERNDSVVASCTGVGWKNQDYTPQNKHSSIQNATLDKAEREDKATAELPESGFISLDGGYLLCHLDTIKIGDAVHVVEIGPVDSKELYKVYLGEGPGGPWTAFGDIWQGTQKKIITTSAP